MVAKSSDTGLGMLQRLSRRLRAPSTAHENHASSIRSKSPKSYTESASIVDSTSGGQGNFLVEALHELSENDRELVRRYVVTDSADRRDTFAQTLDLAQNLQQQCRERLHARSAAGAAVVASTDKLVGFLGKISVVGDIVANVDPIHFGLPWAGIRLILKIAIDYREHGSALVQGLEAVLYMSDALKIHYNHLTKSSPSAAVKLFRSTLVQSYAKVLAFLASAMRSYHQKSRIVRAVSTLWTQSDVDDFRNDTQYQLARLTHDAAVLDRADRQHERRLQEEKERDLKLDGLPSAKGAVYDPQGDGSLPTCLENTRVSLLDQITQWTNSPHGKPILWLRGNAGTGKSTIVRTIATKLHEDNKTCATFFFQRRKGDCSRAQLFFPTIAKQFARASKVFLNSLCEAIGSRTDLQEKSFRFQFETFLSQPFSRIEQEFGSTSFILIDALDECDNLEDVEEVLKLLVTLTTNRTNPMRILMTSRPDNVLIDSVNHICASHYDYIRLEETASIQNDLTVFLNDEFSRTKKRHNQKRSFSRLPNDWPLPKHISKLADMSDPLFIAAFTISRYIALALNPAKALEEVVSQTKHYAEGNQNSGLVQTYISVLENAVSGCSEDSRKEEIFQLLDILGPLILLANALSANSLASLLNVSVEDIDLCVSPLRSVLNLENDTWDPDQPIKLFHLSFREFLVNPALRDSIEFWVDESSTHIRLATCCLNLLDKSLKQDICNVRLPGTRRMRVDSQVVNEHISKDVAYACLYWTNHFADSGQEHTGHDLIERFCTSHLLHWMEALSWLGKASDIIHNLRELGRTVEKTESPTLKAFVADAIRFALLFRRIIDEAPLQTYLSALIFAPKKSVVRQTFDGDLGQTFSVLPRVTDYWNADVLKLQGHTNQILEVAYSNNGKKIVSGSSDSTVKVWDVATGTDDFTLEGHTKSVCTVAISADGSLVVSGGGYDDSIRVWNAETGTLIRQLVNFEPKKVCLSSDGQVIASMSCRGEVKLWASGTGKELLTLDSNQRYTTLGFSGNGRTLAMAYKVDYITYEHSVHVYFIKRNNSESCELETSDGFPKLLRLHGHQHWISAVALSLDGQIVASASNDKTVRVWDTTAGSEIHVLHHDAKIESLSIAGDGNTIATGSNTSIYLWSVTTGEELGRFDGHTSNISTLAMSDLGDIVVSGSYDTSLRLWERTTDDTRAHAFGSQTDPTKHTAAIMAAAISADGTTAVSGSLDRTLRVWDVATGSNFLRLDGHDREVLGVAISKDGGTIASGSSDLTTRVWDAKRGSSGTSHSNPEIRTNVLRCDKHRGVVFSVGISADGTKTVSGTHSSPVVRMWDSLTDQQLELVGHERSMQTVAISADGRIIASGCPNGLYVWRPSENHSLALDGHTEPISAIALSSTGEKLVSASLDKTVRLWNALTGQEMQRFMMHDGTERIWFSQDETAVMTDNETFLLFTSAGKPPEVQVIKSWIKWQGTDYLWIPHGHRGRHAFSQGRTVIMDHLEDYLCFLRFRDD